MRLAILLQSLLVLVVISVDARPVNPGSSIQQDSEYKIDGSAALDLSGGSQLTTPTPEETSQLAKKTPRTSYKPRKNSRQLNPSPKQRSTKRRGPGKEKKQAGFGSDIEVETGNEPWTRNGYGLNLRDLADAAEIMRGGDGLEMQGANVGGASGGDSMLGEDGFVEIKLREPGGIGNAEERRGVKRVKLVMGDENDLVLRLTGQPTPRHPPIPAPVRIQTSLAMHHAGSFPTLVRQQPVWTVPPTQRAWHS